MIKIQKNNSNTIPKTTKIIKKNRLSVFLENYYKIQTWHIQKTSPNVYNVPVRLGRKQHCRKNSLCLIEVFLLNMGETWIIVIFWMTQTKCN